MQRRTGRYYFDLSVARYAAVQGANPILSLVFPLTVSVPARSYPIAILVAPVSPVAGFGHDVVSRHFLESRCAHCAVAIMSERVPTITDTIGYQPVDSEAVSSTADTSGPGRFTVGPHVSAHGTCECIVATTPVGEA